ncbi:hypothetical protein ACR2YN_25340 [Klebsiella pneumoniae]|uniref:hypothetical protein n=1 Tax=Enterobacteriaceae TaxID=543 RepID=UPI000B91ACCC|nr:hypothetical protein [Salmonella enterica]OXY01197.1 hypothetical protein P700_05040 [Salmonella enterica subsp. enterica serovar Newport str. CVM75_1280]HCB3564361.1 hypothetical protein [Klebsiella pneumoniae]HDG5333931.1 hypothetical protein [Klebsiella pneumoniae]HDG5339332.1 hypothetical protein [Klebsiella pneumoniae]
MGRKRKSKYKKHKRMVYIQNQKKQQEENEHYAFWWKVFSFVVITIVISIAHCFYKNDLALLTFYLMGLMFSECLIDQKEKNNTLKGLIKNRRFTITIDKMNDFLKTRKGYLTMNIIDYTIIISMIILLMIYIYIGVPEWAHLMSQMNS